MTNAIGNHGECDICAMSLASDVNHCGWCGSNFLTTDELHCHLSDGCFQSLLNAVGMHLDMDQSRA